MKTKFFLLAFIIFCCILFPFHSCKKLSPCKDINCQNGGTCSDGKCTCATGYEGTDCATEIRAKFLGTYNFSENCSVSGVESYQLIVTSSSAGTDKIDMKGIYDQNLTITASVSVISLTIENQNFGQGKISGDGSISGNSLSLSYTVTSGNNSDTCTGSGSK